MHTKNIRNFESRVLLTGLTIVLGLFSVASVAFSSFQTFDQPPEDVPPTTDPGGGPPPAALNIDNPKLIVYSGVVTLQPTTSAATADRLMELGSYDVAADSLDIIASATDTPTVHSVNLYLRPNGNVVSVGPRDSTTGGGKIVLQRPSNAATGDFSLESFVESGVSYFGAMFNGQKQFWVGTSGDAHIKTGSRLCFGGDCKDSWSQIGGGADDLNAIVDYSRWGNGSNHPIVLGQGGGAGTKPTTAMLDLTTSTKNALSAKSDVPLQYSDTSSFSPESALFVDNSAGPTVFPTGRGYAGYFSGRVGFFQPVLRFPAIPRRRWSG